MVNACSQNELENSLWLSILIHGWNFSKVNISIVMGGHGHPQFKIMKLSYFCNFIYSKIEYKGRMLTSSQLLSFIPRITFGNVARRENVWLSTSSLLCVFSGTISLHLVSTVDNGENSGLLLLKHKSQWWIFWPGPAYFHKLKADRLYPRYYLHSPLITLTQTNTVERWLKDICTDRRMDATNSIISLLC